MKTSILRTLYLAVLLAFGLASQAQRHSFNSYGLNEGVPQSQVLAVEQDRDGFLWLGTLGGGACRFDGIEFRYYNIKNGLPNNTVWDILEDREGNIWLATVEGICRFDGHTFEIFTTDDGLPDNEAYALYQASNGDIWIGTEGGVCVYSTTGIIPLKDADGVPEIATTCIEQTEDGSIWLGQFGGGITVFRDDGIARYTSADGLVSDYINCIEQDYQGRIWIGTTGGLSTWHQGAIEPPPYGGELAGNTIMALLEDRKNNFWIGTARGGVCYHDGASIKTFTEAQGLSANGVFDILEDNTGSVWIGTDGGGISHYFGDRFIHITKAEGLSSNQVMALTCDRVGNTWIGTEDEGLFVYHGQSVKASELPEQARNHTVTALFTDAEGHIWAGFTEALVGRFSNGNWMFFDGANGYGVEQALGMAQASDGTLWFAGIGGLSSYHPTQGFTHIDASAGLAGQDLMDVAVAKDGSVWLATASNGIQKFEGGTFTTYTASDGLASNFTTCIEVGPAGQIWVGSDKGLTRFDREKFQVFTEADGLSSDNVYSLIFDQSANLFVGSGVGLDRLTLAQDRSIVEIRHYGFSEGFTGVECNAGVVSMDTDRNLWFGTILGATRYNYRLDIPNITLPKTHITNVRLFFDKVNWQSKADSLSAFFDLPLSLQLPYDQNHLTFDFTGINLKYPEGVKYQWRLAELEDSWSNPSHRREVTYSNLPPGSYTFLVRSGNADNVWNEQPASFAFTVVPPYWQTWWFNLILVVVLIALIYLVIRIRTLRLVRIRKQLKQKVEEATAELRAQANTLEKLSLVASGTTEGVLIANATGYIEWMNPAFERLSGFPLEAFRQHYGSTLHQITSLENFDEQVRNAIANQSSISYQTLDVTGHDQQIWTQATITPILDSNNKLIRFVGIYTDISRQKKAERKLLQINKDLTDSIDYASQIQKALLPKMYTLTLIAPESFIFYQPRDVVSGDFPWFTEVNDTLVLAAVDCTGHGVPGALMSMISHEMLSQVINDPEINDPSIALELLDQRIISALNQELEEGGQQDGLDIALAAVNKERKLQFSGARRPLMIVRNNDIIEIKPEKVSVGGVSSKPKAFVTREMQLEKGDRLYLFSDGFNDQFGGPKNKKYLMKRFRQLLLEMVPLTMVEQELHIQRTFKAWKGGNMQVDDVLVMGVEIS